MDLISLIVISIVAIHPSLGESTSPTHQDTDRWIANLQDSDPQVRAVAVDGFVRIGRVEPATVLRLASLLDAKAAGTRTDVLTILERIGPDAKPAVSHIVSILADENSVHRYHAALTLRGIGPSAASAVPSLIRILRSKSSVGRAAATKALGGIGEEAGQAVPILFDMALHDGGGGFAWDIRSIACSAIAEIGAPALPVLRQAQEGGNADQRVLVADILYQMSTISCASASHARTLIDKSLTDQHQLVRVLAAMTLWNLDKNADKARPILLATVRDYVRSSRSRSAYYGTKGTSIVPPREVRAAMIGLGAQEAAAAPAVPLLREILRNPAMEPLHEAAVTVLGAIGNVARPALPEIDRLSKSPDVRMRRAAASARASILRTAKGSSE